jgi:hypothetical protein
MLVEFNVKGATFSAKAGLAAVDRIARASTLASLVGVTVLDESTVPL